MSGSAVFVLMIGLAAILLSVALYFLPTYIAFARSTRHQMGVFAVNVLLGWTFLGWVAALVWAVSDDKL